MIHIATVNWHTGRIIAYGIDPPDASVEGTVSDAVSDPPLPVEQFQAPSVLDSVIE